MIKMYTNIKVQKSSQYMDKKPRVTGPVAKQPSPWQPVCSAVVEGGHTSEHTSMK